MEFIHIILQFLEEKIDQITLIDMLTLVISVGAFWHTFWHTKKIQRSARQDALRAQIGISFNVPIDDLDGLDFQMLSFEKNTELKKKIKNLRSPLTQVKAIVEASGNVNWDKKKDDLYQEYAKDIK